VLDKIKKVLEIKMVKEISLNPILATLCSWWNKWKYPRHWRKPNLWRPLYAHQRRGNPLTIHSLSLSHQKHSKNTEP